MSPEVERLLVVIRTAMRVLGFSIREVERRLGLSTSYLGRLLSGRVELKVEHVVAIARAMEIDPADLFLIAFSNHPPRGENAVRVQYALASFPLPQAAGGGPPPSFASAEEVEELLEKTMRRLFTEFGHQKSN